MSLSNSSVFVAKSVLPAVFPSSSCEMSTTCINSGFGRNRRRIDGGKSKLRLLCAVGGGNNNNANSNNRGRDSDKKKGMANSNYVVPLDKSFSSCYSSCITRPLAKILRDLNKRIPDNIIRYHANRMLSFYAPGWCVEIRDVIFSDNGSVTVVYRVTIRGSDGEWVTNINVRFINTQLWISTPETISSRWLPAGLLVPTPSLAYRESIGTVSSSDNHIVDSVAAAEEIAFCRACARFGLGLYLYHEE